MSKTHLSLVTCTGDRPQAFNLCCQWVHRQKDESINPQPYWDSWVVIDDSSGLDNLTTNISSLSNILPTLNTPKVKYASREPVVEGNSFKRNMLDALKYTKGDIICFVEDDDYYDKAYFQAVRAAFENFDCQIFGLTDVTYYNIKQAKYRNIRNNTYCPMAFTAIKKELVPLLIECLETKDSSADIALWHRAKEKGLKMCKQVSSSLGIGVKGMPGRAGLTASHTILDNRWLEDDSEFNAGRTIFGDDFVFYEPFIRESKIDRGSAGSGNSSKRLRG